MKQDMNISQQSLCSDGANARVRFLLGKWVCVPLLALQPHDVHYESQSAAGLFLSCGALACGFPA